MIAVVRFAAKDREVIDEAIREIEAIAEDESDNTFTVDRSRKIGGATVTTYDVPDRSDGLPLWYFVTENELYFGINANETLDALEKNDTSKSNRTAPTDPASTGMATIRCEMDSLIDLVRLLEHEEETVEQMDRILNYLGLSSMTSLEASIGVDGSDFNQLIRLELPDRSKGVAAALRPIPESGPGTPPPLPPMEPALFRIHASLSPEKLTAAFAELKASRRSDDEDQDAIEEEADDEDDIRITPAQIRKFLGVFDGGFSFLLVGPAVGGLLPVPRLVLTAGIQDPTQYDTELAALKEALEGIGFDDREYKGVKMTTVRIPNNATPIQPSFAVIDGALYFAETPVTLRDLVNGLQGEGETWTADTSSQQEDVLVCDYDTREIFRLMYERLLPLIQLGMSQVQRMSGMGGEPLVSMAELPNPKIVAKYLHSGDARITWRDGALEMTARSPIGDPLTALAMSVSTPLSLIQTGIALDMDRAEWEQRVCRARLERIHEALKLHRQTFGSGNRYPTSLGDLLSRGLIEDESMFLVPSDDDPLTVEYETEDGDIADLEVSYKYLPRSKLVAKKKTLERAASDTAMLMDMIDLDEIFDEIPDAKADKSNPELTIYLYEAQANDHMGRFVMTTDGGIYHVSEEAFQDMVSIGAR